MEHSLRLVWKNQLCLLLNFKLFKVVMIIWENVQSNGYFFIELKLVTITKYTICKVGTIYTQCVDYIPLGPNVSQNLVDDITTIKMFLGRLLQWQVFFVR